MNCGQAGRLTFDKSVVEEYGEAMNMQRSAYTKIRLFVIDYRGTHRMNKLKMASKDAFGQHTSQEEIHEVPSVKRVFDTAYVDSEVYQRGESACNVARLLRRLQQAGIDLSEVAVVSVKGPAGACGKEQRHVFDEWSMHLFAVHQGVALDLDFHSQPTILPVTEYLDRQFLSPNQQTRDQMLERWKATILRGDQYARHFNFNGSLKKDQSTQSEDEVRCVSLRNFLSEVTNHPNWHC
jgi:hypothetical protein